MAKARLIRPREFERDYQISNGQVITLKIDEEWRIITFHDSMGKKFDEEFHFQDDDGERQRYLLSRMYAPITRNGLGRAALEFFISVTNATVYARQIHDKYGDGSDLTGNAPEFVNAMVEEGLLEDPEKEYY